MKKILLCALLCAGLILGLTACGGSPQSAATAPPDASAAPTQAPEATPAPTAAATPAPTAEPVSYEEVYLRFLSVYASIADEVQRRVEMHNAVLKGQYPDSYYMNSNYLMQDCIPFLPAYPAMGSALRDGDLSAAEASLRQRWPDAVLQSSAPGVYEARYTYVDKTSGQEVERKGRCVWECDGALGSLRVRAWVDDDMVEFTEFIPQGKDSWLLYTMADKILVSCKDGSVTSLRHAHRINQPPQSRFAGDVRYCSLEIDDFYPNGDAAPEWITQDADAEYILTLDAGEMVYRGKVPQDLVDDHGMKIGVTWQEIDPITLLK